MVELMTGCQWFEYKNDQKVCECGNTFNQACKVHVYYKFKLKDTDEFFVFCDYCGHEQSCNKSKSVG